MSGEDIWQAIMRPEPLMSNQASFSPEAMQMIALLRALRSVGISTEELHGLCEMLQSDVTYTEKVVSLRRTRFRLLAHLHEQQRVLDELDSYVEAIKKARK